MDVVKITRNLDVSSVLTAYTEGRFPMGHPGRSLITWHQPDMRAILPLDKLHISRSLQRTLRKSRFAVTFNKAFLGVMQGCADRDSTWITRDIFRVYSRLHDMGRAHSVEVWIDNELVGGVYGVHIGAAFFAESKFHRATDMSKVALVSLAQRLKECGFLLLEVQYLTDHLEQFGVIEVTDRDYRKLLTAALAKEVTFP